MIKRFFNRLRSRRVNYLINEGKYPFIHFVLSVLILLILSFFFAKEIDGEKSILELVKTNNYDIWNMIILTIPPLLLVYFFYYLILYKKYNNGNKIKISEVIFLDLVFSTFFIMLALRLAFSILGNDDGLINSFEIYKSSLTIIIIYSFILVFLSINSTLLTTLQIEESRKSIREKRIEEICKEQNVSQVEAREIYKQEAVKIVKQEMEDELLGGFLKVLESIRYTRKFYMKLMIFFIFIAIVSVVLIFSLTQSDIYNEVSYENKSVGMVVAEGFFSNIRFFIFESMLITLLIYCLKKVSSYISLMEIYKEWEILLVMDVQRQDKKNKDEEKGILSGDFQKIFTERVIKREDSLFKDKSEMKLKTASNFYEKMIQNMK